MKKLLCLFLALCLVLPLAGCRNDDPQVTTTAPTTTGAIALKDMPLRVGVLYPCKSTDEKAGAYTIHKDLSTAILRRGLNPEEVLIVEDLVPELKSDVMNAIDRLVENGALIIFGTALGYNEELAEAADKYPNVVFCQMGGLNGNDSNFVTYFAPLYQYYYMLGGSVGYWAMTEEFTDVGFLSTSGKDHPEAAAIINAFTRGVQVYQPSATVHLKVLEPGATADMEVEAVKDLQQLQGCQAIGSYTHTVAAAEGADELDLYANGPWFAVTDESYGNLPSLRIQWLHFFNQAFDALERCRWADEFAMALETTHYYGTFHDSTVTKPSPEDSLFLDPEATVGVAMSILGPKDTYRVLPVLPDETDGPDATVGTTLVPNISQGPFAGFLYTVTILDPKSAQMTHHEAAMVDTDGNVRVPAGALGMEVDEIREMDYYVDGVNPV